MTQSSRDRMRDCALDSQLCARSGRRWQQIWILERDNRCQWPFVL